MEGRSGRSFGGRRWEIGVVEKVGGGMWIRELGKLYVRIEGRGAI